MTPMLAGIRAFSRWAGVRDLNLEDLYQLEEKR